MNFDFGRRSFDDRYFVTGCRCYRQANSTSAAPVRKSFVNVRMIAPAGQWDVFRASKAGQKPWPDLAGGERLARLPGESATSAARSTSSEKANLEEEATPTRRASTRIDIVAAHLEVSQIPSSLVSMSMLLGLV